MASFLAEDGTGLAGANSFVSVATADGLLEQDPDREKWKCLSSQQREVALRFATRWLNEKFRWYGDAFNPGVQSLQWPRTKVVDEFDQVIGPGGVPSQIERATALLAMELAKADSLSKGASDLTAEVESDGGVRSFTLDQLSVDFDTSGTASESLYRDFAGKRFPQVELLVASLGELKGVDHLAEALKR